jgi:ABC-type nitrate/sulfonate/bicarbonate transport system permease component
MTRQKSANDFNLAQRFVAEGVVVLFLVAWWLASSNLPNGVLPSPYTVFWRTIDLFTVPSLLVHSVSTLLRVMSAVTIAMMLGFILALAARATSWMDAIISNRILIVLNALPSLGWVMLALIWFRMSNFSVLFVEVMILLPFSMVNFMAGLRNLDHEVIEMAFSFTRGRSLILRKVVLPMVLPYGVAALRTSHGICWKISLVAELFGTPTGLGQLMLQAESVGDGATIFAACFAIFLLYTAGEKLVIDPTSRFAHAGNDSKATAA